MHVSTGCCKGLDNVHITQACYWGKMVVKGWKEWLSVNQLESFSVVGVHGKLHDGNSQHRGTLWWSSLCSEVHESKVRPVHWVLLQIGISQTVWVSRQWSIRDFSHLPLWRRGSSQMRRWEEGRGRTFTSSCNLSPTLWPFSGSVFEHSGGSAPPCHPEERGPGCPALLLLWDRGQARHQQLWRPGRVSQHQHGFLIKI